MNHYHDYRVSIFTAQTSFTDSSSHLSLIHSQPGIRTDLLLVVIDYFAGWSFKVNRIKLYPLLSWLLPLMTIFTYLCYVCLRPILMLESQSFLWIAELYCIIWDLHLSFYCNKTLNKNNLRKKGFVLVPCPEVQSSMVEKSRQRRLKQQFSPHSKSGNRGMNVWSVSIYTVKEPSQGMVPHNSYVFVPQLMQSR